MQPDMRFGKPCPREYANVILGERFGHWPWEIEDEPLDRVLYYLQVLGVEGETRALLEDLPRDERLIREGD